MQKTYSPKKFYIETFGCQANEADSSRLSAILKALDMEQTDNLEKAYIFIINSCSVRQKSEDKVYGLAKKLKEFDKKPFVVLAGCMVGSVKGNRTRYDFDELNNRTPWVDLYIGPEEILQLPSYLVKEGLIQRNATDVLGEVSTPFVDEDRGYVNISYGCDNFCSYCVVPYARGKEISRPKEEIIREAETLLEKGITHITLCGQNVNSWGLSPELKRQIRIGDDNRLPFAELLREVHDLAGIKKLSFISSNPFDFTNELIETLKLPKIDNYLHIAVQSGNNDVLVRMNRRHTIEEFISLVDKIKTVKLDLELGTDIIVGFPGETRKQFMDTVELIEKVKFKVAYIAMYSPRKGTAAEKFYEDDVSPEEKKWRHAYLTKVWKENRE